MRGTICRHLRFEFLRLAARLCPALDLFGVSVDDRTVAIQNRTDFGFVGKAGFARPVVQFVTLLAFVADRVDLALKGAHLAAELRHNFCMACVGCVNFSILLRKDLGKGLLCVRHLIAACGSFSPPIRKPVATPSR